MFDTQAATTETAGEAARDTACSFTATYSPDDNKLRISCTRRLDSETFARVKAAGYKWAPKQEQFIAPMWTPSREDLALELAGAIGDEDTSLIDRAEVRAERFETYSGKRANEADRAHAHVESIVGSIPLGQPILVGHHSERRARKDAERISDGMRKALKLWDTSEYWKQRAAGALAHAKYKELPAVRARRIKGIQADLRKALKLRADSQTALERWSKPNLTHEEALHLAGGSCSFRMARKEGDKEDFNQSPSAYDVLSGSFPSLYAPRTLQEVIETGRRVFPRSIAYRNRWIAHYENRLAYEIAMLNEQGASDLITKKPRPKQLPLVNYKQASFTLPARWRRGETETLEQIELSTAEYMAINADCRGGREVDNSHRIRTALIARNEDGTLRRFAGYQAKLCAVFLTDSKVHKKPEPMEKAVMATPARTFEPREPKPVDERAAKFEALKEASAQGVQVASGAELFPTPEPLAARMVEELCIQPGDSILEPSAGTGALMAAVGQARIDCHGVAIELAAPLANALSARFMSWNVLQGDFLEMKAEDLGEFERIVMNPPFSAQADIDHVTHALTFLKPGGRLVAVMSAGVTFRQDKKAAAFRELVEVRGGTIEELPEDSFKPSGTSVRTVLVNIV